MVQLFGLGNGCPFLIQVHPFVKEERLLLIDLHVHTLHVDSFLVTIVPDPVNGAIDSAIKIKTAVPEMFLDRDRVRQEIAILGTRSVYLAAHTEYVDSICTKHGHDQIVGPPSNHPASLPD